jgi:hypothetical protein
MLGGTIKRESTPILITKLPLDIIHRWSVCYGFLRGALFAFGLATFFLLAAFLAGFLPPDFLVAAFLAEPPLPLPLVGFLTTLPFLVALFLVDFLRLPPLGVALPEPLPIFRLRLEANLDFDFLRVFLDFPGWVVSSDLSASDFTIMLRY